MFDFKKEIIASEMSRIEEIEYIKSILNKNGIKLQVDGCGCCGSPVLYFEHGDVKISGENFSFSTEEYGYFDEK